MNRLRKEQLKERLEKLDADEHAQIFEIVKRYTAEFTRTQTGVLVSSETLPDACLLEMERMVTYFFDQRKWMEGTSRT
jgi:phosphopantetheine adenylyltransferase